MSLPLGARDVPKAFTKPAMRGWRLDPACQSYQVSSLGYVLSVLLGTSYRQLLVVTGVRRDPGWQGGDPLPHPLPSQLHLKSGKEKVKY